MIVPKGSHRDRHMDRWTNGQAASQEEGRRNDCQALTACTPVTVTHTDTHTRYNKRNKNKGPRCTKTVRKKVGRRVGELVSPPGVWPPSSAYKLQRPWQPGAGNEAPAVAWARAAGAQSCSGPSGGAVATVQRGSLGWWGRQGKFSSHWLVSHRHPGTSPCDAGLLVAGPHCWAWALAGD